jgi:hypothetical protein
MTKHYTAMAKEDGSDDDDAPQNHTCGSALEEWINITKQSVQYVHSKRPAAGGKIERAQYCTVRSNDISIKENGSRKHSDTLIKHSNVDQLLFVYCCTVNDNTLRSTTSGIGRYVY